MNVLGDNGADELVLHVPVYKLLGQDVDDTGYDLEEMLEALVWVDLEGRLQTSLSLSIYTYLFMCLAYLHKYRRIHAIETESLARREANLPPRT